MFRQCFQVSSLGTLEKMVAKSAWKEVAFECYQICAHGKWENKREVLCQQVPSLSKWYSRKCQTKPERPFHLPVAM